MTNYKGRLFLDRHGPIRTALRHIFDHPLNRAKLALRIRIAAAKRNRSGAVFIGVTGSSAKTTTSSLIVHILASQGNVESQIVQNYIKDILRKLMKLSSEIQYFVAEVAVGRKGHAKAISQFLMPDIAIVTMVGIEHYSWYRSRQAVAEEKGHLVENIKSGGFALLNTDDENVMAMATRTRARIVTFGWSKNADYRVVSTDISRSGGLVVDVKWNGGAASLHTHVVGEQFWLSTVAAFAVARELELPLDVVCERIESFPGVRGRCEIYPTKSGPCFILDTVKAPNETLSLAFDMMKSLAAKRKIIVLGNISDYPGNPKPKYRDAYRNAREAADQVIYVGTAAHRSKASPADRESQRFLMFATPKQVFDHLRSTAGKGEKILLKGSQNLHLERIAFAWDGEVKCWEPECGKRVDCRKCGLYQYPFSEHRKLMRTQKRRSSTIRSNSQS